MTCFIMMDNGVNMVDCYLCGMLLTEGPYKTLLIATGNISSYKVYWNHSRYIHSTCTTCYSIKYDKHDIDNKLAGVNVYLLIYSSCFVFYGGAVFYLPKAMCHVWRLLTLYIWHRYIHRFSFMSLFLRSVTNNNYNYVHVLSLLSLLLVRVQLGSYFFTQAKLLNGLMSWMWSLKVKIVYSTPGASSKCCKIVCLWPHLMIISLVRTGSHRGRIIITLI